MGKGSPSFTLQKTQANVCRRSLYQFVRESWHVIEPDARMVDNWHIKVICDHVQALVEGKLPKRNLIINVPPGSMKSTILSVCLPAWKWTLNPEWRGLFISGNIEVALRDSIKCRDILDSDWYRSTFLPDWGFSPDQNAKGHYKNTRTGFRKAISAGARITGERGHAIIVDDPNDAAEAFSKPARDQIIQWWDNAAANRLVNMSLGNRIVIQQRLHGDDLTGHILTTEPDAWEVLIIREEYEPPQKDDPDRVPTGLGWSDPRRVEGELFFPERFPADVVAGEKRRLGISSYAGQHQQRPTPAGGAIFRKGFVQRFTLEAMPKFKRTVLSFDTAFKANEENDFSVGLAIGETDFGYYVFSRWKERATYPDLKQKAKDMGTAYKPTAFLVEDAASGQSLIQELKMETSLPVVPVTVDGDKVSRAWSITPQWEAGRVFVLEGEGAEWADDFLDQLYGFPKLAHDDDVDAFTQGIKYLYQGGGNMGMWDWLKQEADTLKAVEEEQEGLTPHERMERVLQGMRDRIAAEEDPEVEP
jgi:predicted phage terminase large subunit-like protein